MRSPAMCHTFLKHDVIKQIISYILPSRVRRSGCEIKLQYDVRVKYSETWII